MSTTNSYTRRRFIAASAAAVAAGEAITQAVAHIAPERDPPQGPAPVRQSPLADAHGPAVVGFHQDRPFLDVSGRSLPYHAPLGARGGDGVSVPEGALLGQFGYC